MASTNYTYQLLNLEQDGNAKSPYPTFLVPRRLFRLSRRSTSLIISISLLLFISVFYWLGNLRFSSIPRDTFPWAKYFNDVELPDAGDRRFVIILPANNPGPELCKVITSAMALGYPAPVIVNWGKDFQKSSKDFGMSHLGKITGTLEYLNKVTQPDVEEKDRLDDQDIILVMDAYDAWFQLPPGTILRRYFEANQQANARSAQEWNDLSSKPANQTILISSQKSCYPKTSESGSNLHCNALPESPLAEALYGIFTDWKLFSFHNVRPRYVNSGTVIGPVGDMRRLFRRAKETMDRGFVEGIALYSDQGILGEVFGEQEIWRSLRRKQGQEGGELMYEESSSSLESYFELHAGLDYTQGTSYPTVYVEEDGDFIALGNETVIQSHSKRLGISPPRVSGVPYDLAHVYNPLENIPDDRISRLKWDSLALYVDFFTANVPAILHHNAWVNGLKQRRMWWWDRTWYFPYLRQLMEMQLTPGPLKPIATLPAKNGRELRFWPVKSEETKRRPRIFDHGEDGNGRVRKEGLVQAEWDDICRYSGNSDRHWSEEVFRDGKGSP